MATMDQGATMCIKKEGADDDPNKTGSTVQLYPCCLNIKEELEDEYQEVLEDPLKIEELNVHLKQDRELKHHIDGSEHKDLEDPLKIEEPNLYVKQDPELNYHMDGSQFNVLEDPLKVEESDLNVKRDPELKHHADGFEHKVVSSRRCESDSTRLIQGTGEGCNISPEGTFNDGVVPSELQVDTEESTSITMYNTGSQRWSSGDSSFTTSLKCLRANDLNKFSCSFCLQSFTYKYRLIKHVFTHIDGVQPPKYVCKSCGVVFHSNINLNEHLKSVEGDQATRQDKCDASGTSFSECQLLIHAVMKPHKCNTCGKTFDHSGHLKSHTLIHTGERPHKCVTCGKTFTRLSYLKEHTLMHTGKSPHKCSTCGKTFARLDHLKHHSLIHTGVRAHKCNTCEKSFTGLGHLKRHTVIHTGMRAHKCDTCGKSFTQLDHLKSHSLIQTGMKQHKCNTCGKTFARLGHLKIHSLIYTGEILHKCVTYAKLLLV